MHDDFSPPPVSGGWDSALLAPVAEINQQMLACLRQMALDTALDNASDAPRQDAPRRDAPRQDAPRQDAPRLVTLLRADWRRLDASAQRRVAACPYLLLDAGFAQPQRWERTACAGVMESSVMDSSVMDSSEINGNAPRGYFGGRDGVALVRRTLVLAWHLARANRVSGRVILGMSALSAERIACARLADLEALAELAPGWIVPRWEAQPPVWRQLIDAGCRGQPLQLRQAQLRGLQLLARPNGPG